MQALEPSPLGLLIMEGTGFPLRRDGYYVAPQEVRLSVPAVDRKVRYPHNNMCFLKASYDSVN